MAQTERIMTPNATTQAEALLLVETTDGIATVTLNRPGQFNALSSALIDELQSTLDRIAADPGVRVVVLAAQRARLLRGPRSQGDSGHGRRGRRSRRSSRAAAG